nr:transposase [Geodermatophilus obscurus]
MPLASPAAAACGAGAAPWLRSPGLLSAVAVVGAGAGQLKRRNGWSLAEAACTVSPDVVQRLLRTADWNADAVRDQLRGHVLGRLHPSAVRIVDETECIKKSAGWAGEARQHTGSTSETDKCQIGVFLLACAGAARALMDRELYLPRAWTDDRDRAAGMALWSALATRPTLVRRMPTRALTAGVPARWRAADAVQGCAKRLRV